MIKVPVLSAAGLAGRVRNEGQTAPDGGNHGLFGDELKELDLVITLPANKSGLFQRWNNRSQRDSDGAGHTKKTRVTVHRPSDTTVDFHAVIHKNTRKHSKCANLHHGIFHKNPCMTFWVVLFTDGPKLELGDCGERTNVDFCFGVN